MRRSKIARENIRSVLQAQGNLMFRTTFVKSNGEIRSMVSRLGVKNHLHGGENTVESISNPYLTVFDMHTEDYRTVNIHTVKELKVCGEIFTVEDRS